MSRFACNIDSKGRRIRLAITILCFLAAGVAWFGLRVGWLTWMLAGCGLVGLIEVARGWCLLKALGIRMPW